MIHIKLISLLSFLLVSATGSASSPATPQRDESYAELKRGFLSPGDEYRPRVWWHWMNGNISRDGLEKDLDWLYRSGIRGVHIFDANLDTPLIVDHKVDYMSEEWKSIFSGIVAKADSLGMEVTIASSPGFSSSGGPWVTPGDAMKKLVWSETFAEGGSTIDIVLPEPPKTTGPFADIPCGLDVELYGDIAVLAARMPEDERTMEELGAVVSRTADSITISFPESVTAKAVTCRNGITRGERHSNPAVCLDSLEVSDDGRTWRTIAGIPLGCCLQQTFDIDPVSAKYFRISRIKEAKDLRIHTVTKVNHFEEKAEFGAAHDIRLFPTPPTGERELSPEAIDITRFADGGKLHWNAPEGRWRIIRLGYSLTGKQNHPASPEATGLEVDKLDPDAWTRYFRQYLDMMKEAAGGLLGQRGIQYVLVDSYEAGFQNWTPRLLEEFRSRRGYDALPWMPALTGTVIRSSAGTERFLHDWRTTLGELFTENYALLSDIVRREYGMKGCYIEAHASGSIFPADGMAIKKTAEFPMGEMWIPGKENRTNRIPEGNSDIRESSSATHIYGREFTAAESFTAKGLHRRAWTYWPGNIKPTADWELKAGVTRFVLHDCAAQPRDDKFPGLGLGQYGHWFNRHECWAEQAGPWIDYLARSSYMLSRGRNVADILWYFGEETNVTSYYSDSLPVLPEGYEYDFAGPDALLNGIHCSDGILHSNSGTSYKVLYIDPHITIFSDRIKEKIAELKAAGAIVCGIGPGNGVTLEQALAGAGPDVDCKSPIRHRHRQLAGGLDIYWLNNASPEPAGLTLSFRIAGKVPHVWHPEDGRIERPEYFEKDGRSFVKLEFVEDDAFFVVFTDSADKLAPASQSIRGWNRKPVSGEWTVRFQEGRRAPESIRLKKLSSLSGMAQDGIRFFSGTASYSISFKAARVNGRCLLDLGDVRNIAEVKLNGKDLGTLWKAPYRVDVSGILRKGTNELEVKVTNLWVNRLVGDARPEEKHPLTYSSMKFYDADDPLLPSGLIGPVTIINYQHNKSVQ